MPELSTLLRLAQNTSKYAARIVQKDLTMHQKVEEDLERDVKVFADKNLESIIVKRLLEESSYPILSEESGLIGECKKNTDISWIIDPLDGSLNFSRGIPINCISIALWKGMEPLLGVVHDFNHNEIFSGIVGIGAWLNRNPIAISKVTKKSKAVLCTGFPVSTDFSKKSLLEFIEDIRRYKKIRLLGSAALSLAYVACARADVYTENDIKIWDVAAGIAIVKAAGGVVKFAPTEKENIFKVKASNLYL
jgi:myo-inositol-1(or 4)-monophosphatase